MQPSTHSFRKSCQFDQSVRTSKPSSQIFTALQTLLLVSSLLFTKYPNVKTPRFIRYNYKEHVLISMTDLGPSVVWIGVRVTIDDWLAQELPPLPAEDVERIATDLDRFLGEFAIATSKPSVEHLSLPQLPFNSSLLHQFDGYMWWTTWRMSPGCPWCWRLEQTCGTCVSTKRFWECRLEILVWTLMTSSVTVSLTLTRACLLDWPETQKLWTFLTEIHRKDNNLRH